MRRCTCVTPPVTLRPTLRGKGREEGETVFTGPSACIKFSKVNHHQDLSCFSHIFLLLFLCYDQSCILVLVWRLQKLPPGVTAAERTWWTISDVTCAARSPGTHHTSPLLHDDFCVSCLPPLIPDNLPDFVHEINPVIKGNFLIGNACHIKIMSNLSLHRWRHFLEL